MPCLVLSGAYFYMVCLRMKKNIWGKIWLICLCLSIFSLSGCFHVPDEDWLPSKNKTKTEEVEKDAEIQQAVTSFMDWINMISSQWDEIKGNKKTEDINKTDDEKVNNEEIIDKDIINDEIIVNIEGENQIIENAVLEE